MALIYLYESTETDFRYNGKPLPKAVVDVQWGLNDEFYAMGRYPIDEDEVYKEIVEDRIVKVHTFHGMEPMRIVDVQDRDLYVEFEAWPLFFADMRNKMVKPLNLRNTTGQVALNAFFNNLLIEPRFNFYSNITETHDYHTQDVEERENNPNQLYDALEVFSAIVRRWNGEISIRGYDIRMNNRVGTDTEALLYEKKNITEFLDGTNIKNIVTRAHGKAEWTEEGPDGEQIDRSIQATVDSPLINAYSGIIFERQYTNNDVRSEKELKDWLSLKFSTENLDKPTRSIEVNTNMINGTNVGPADTLILKYIKHDVDMRIKIVGYEYDGFANKLKRFILGEPKATVSNTIGNTITETINNVVRPIAQTAIRAQQSADGKRTKYSGTQDPNTLNLNANKGDEYWRDIGDETIIYEFNGTTWDIIIDTSETTKNAKAIAAQQQEIEEAKQTADDAVERINTDIAGKFTALDEEILAIESISNSAQANAQMALTQSIDALGDASLALTNAQTAINTAGSAISSIQDINMEIDEINGTLAIKADSSTVNAIDGTVSNLSTEVGIIAGELSLKANSSTVDTLTGRVSTAESGITANANAIQLKANQSTVDTLAGTVSSLGTDIGVVAGQISSKVWNTDIKTAVDDIEVGGRNLLKNSKERTLTRRNSGTASDNYNYEGLVYPTVDGQTYTISADVEITDGVLSLISVLVNHGNTGPSNYSVPIENGKITRTYVAHSTTVNNMVLLYAGLAGGTRGNGVIFRNIKIEKGNKATDWTPAPEDTTALINHVESELTQKHDTIAASVSSIDGRVATNTLTLSGAITRVGDAEGRLTTVETNVSGLQTTVASKADQTQITQLDNAIVLKADKTALSTKKDEYTTTITINGNGNTYYPLYFIMGNQSIPRVIRITREYSDPAPGSIWNPNLPTHPGGINMEWVGNFGGWGGASYEESITSFGEIYTTLLADLGREHSSQSYAFYLRGGGARYTISSDQPLDLKVGYSTDDVIWSSFSRDWNSAAPKTSVNRSRIDGLITAQNSQISVLQDSINLRVAKGDVLSQINIEAGRTLIQSKKLVIDAETTIIRGTTWMDATVIKDATIVGAKIADATIGSVKISNLDVSKISGNTTEFVRSAWNAGLDNTTIDASGVYMTGSGAWRRTYLSATGFGLYNGSGGSNKAGAIGYFKEHYDNAAWSENYFAAAKGSKHYIGIGVNNTHNLAFGYQDDSTITRKYTKSLQINGDTGIIRLFRPITTGYSIGHSLELIAGSHRGSPVIGWTNGGNGRGRIYVGDNATFVESGGSTEFYTQSGRHVLTLRETIMARRNIFMDGNVITGTSDARLKTNITDTHINSLDEIKSWNFVDFEWIDDKKQKGVQFGLLAQETSLVSEYDKENDVWGINMSKQVMVNSHAIQQVALMEENTNKVASQALQLVESIKSEIDELREENRDLRNRIEELESVT